MNVLNVQRTETGRVYLPFKERGKEGLRWIMGLACDNEITSWRQLFIVGSREFWRITNKLLKREKSLIATIIKSPKIITSSLNKVNI